jgi:hypothetical protein
MYGDFPHARSVSDIQRYSASVVALVLLVCGARMARADELYKSVDSEGHVVYSDRIDSSTAHQSVVRIDGTQDPPRVLHFCWINCCTLTFENGRYVRPDRSDETWTIERFTSRSVILRRHDVPAAWNGFSTDVTYQGQVSNEQLIDVKVNGNPVPDIYMAWGAALDTLPGSNAERDQRNSGHPMATPSRADIDPVMDVEARGTEAPPPLPDDQQPVCPSNGYLWTPGYWVWGGTGYYWVPGAWVQPPRVGVLWTPGYWGFLSAVYVFHPGYWGPHIGYYGGINYGFGYVGVGFAGGRWVGNSFAYNTAVSNVNPSIIHNTYTETVSNNVAVTKVSYSGWPGGTTAAPTAQERAAQAEPHIPSTPSQRRVRQQAASNAALVAEANRGKPTVAVVNRPATSNSARAMRARTVALPPAHSTAARSTSGQPKLAHLPPNTAAQPQGAPGRP